VLVKPASALPGRVPTPQVLHVGRQDMGAPVKRAIRFLSQPSSLSPLGHPPYPPDQPETEGFVKQTSSGLRRRVASDEHPPTHLRHDPFASTLARSQACRFPHRQVEGGAVASLLANRSSRGLPTGKAARGPFRCPRRMDYFSLRAAGLPAPLVRPVGRRHRDKQQPAFSLSRGGPPPLYKDSLRLPALSRTTI
jgi:hypothetical protein